MFLQKEEELLAKTAVSGSTEDAKNLLDSPGWKTLVTILKESGGFPQQIISQPRPKKRPTQSDAPDEEYAGDGNGESSSGRQGGLGADSEGDGSEEKRLTKKMRGVSLKDKFSLR